MQCSSLLDISLLFGSGRLRIGNHLASLLEDGLGTAAAGNPLRKIHVDLGSTGLTDIGIVSLSRWVCHLPPSVSFFRLQINRNEVHINSLVHLMRALANRPCIRHLALNLEHCLLQTNANRAFRLLGDGSERRRQSLLEVLELKLSHNAYDFTMNCANHLVAGNPNLTRMMLSLDRHMPGPTAFIPAPDGLQCLIGDKDCEALGYLPTLSTLVVSLCNIGCGPMAGLILGERFSFIHQLQLNLTHNFIGTQGARLLANGLSRNSLQMHYLSLGLGSNGIGDAGLCCLMHAVVSMPILQTCVLDVSCNPLSTAGLDYILGCIVLCRTRIATVSLDVRDATIKCTPIQWPCILDCRCNTNVHTKLRLSEAWHFHRPPPLESLHIESPNGTEHQIP